MPDLLARTPPLRRGEEKLAVEGLDAAEKGEHSGRGRRAESLGPFGLQQLREVLQVVDALREPIGEAEARLVAIGGA